MELEREVFELAKGMLGQTPCPEREKSLENMCASAVDELEGRLRENVSMEDMKGSFVRAAATLGLSFYIGAGCLSETESFSAGSVSVKRRSASDTQAAALSLRRQAELMLTGYLTDSGFDFRAVRG